MSADQKEGFIANFNFFSACAPFTFHLPCCGSQLLIGILGFQSIGALSATILDMYQFFIPIIVTCLSALLIWLYQSLINKRNSTDRIFCHLVKYRTRLTKFIFTNLVIGYAITLSLFLFIPPHTHSTINFGGTSHISHDGNYAVTTYQDSSRLWPWSERTFISEISLSNQPAQEIFWYQKQPQLSSLTIPVHLSLHPTANWFQNRNNILPLHPIVQAYAPSLDILLPQITYPHIILFYSEDCTPCHIEMKNIAKLKEAAKGFNMSVLALSPLRQDLEKFLRELGMQASVIQGNLGKVVLQTYQKNSQQLPYSFALDKGGSICSSRLGILGTDIIQKWRQSCLR